MKTTKASWLQEVRQSHTARVYGTDNQASIAPAALCWALDRPGVAAAIVGARHGRHLASTLAALSLELDDDDRSAIDAVLARGTGPSGPFYALEREVGGPHAAIMRYDLNRDQDAGSARPGWKGA